MFSIEMSVQQAKIKELLSGLPHLMVKIVVGWPPNANFKSLFYKGLFHIKREDKVRETIFFALEAILTASNLDRYKHVFKIWDVCIYVHKIFIFLYWKSDYLAMQSTYTIWISCKCNILGIYKYIIRDMMT